MNNDKEKLIKLADRKDCTGCSACAHACSHNAIAMQVDNEGFLYPKIDIKKCVFCRMCEKSCPQVCELTVNNNIPKFYGIKNKDDNIRRNSASGGAFSLFAQYVLELQNASVYGVKFDDKFNVIHDRITCSNDLALFRDSKYVQSDLRDIFKKVKSDLKNDMWVLFSGTPCQVAGLKCFLGRNFEKLITVDIICHGTPSPKIWKDYLCFIEKKYQGTITRYRSRNQWRGIHSMVEVDQKRQYIDTKEVLSYNDIYYSCNMMRPSCYHCHYTNLNRISDITIGDFWGIERVNKEFEDEFGVSLILVNSLKGEKIFEKIKLKTDWIAVDSEKCMQPQLKTPVHIDQGRREKFWKRYNKHGYSYIANLYSRYGLFFRMKNILSKIKRNLIKRK